jgi:hypothetical protein
LSRTRRLRLPPEEARGLAAMPSAVCAPSLAALLALPLTFGELSLTAGWGVREPMEEPPPVPLLELEGFVSCVSMLPLQAVAAPIRPTTHRARQGPARTVRN